MNSIKILPMESRDTTCTVLHQPPHMVLGPTWLDATPFHISTCFLPQPDWAQCAWHILSSPKHSSSPWHSRSLQRAKWIVLLLAISQHVDHGLLLIFSTISLTHQYPKSFFPQNKCFILFEKTKSTYWWFGTNATEQSTTCINLHFH